MSGYGPRQKGPESGSVSDSGASAVEIYIGNPVEHESERSTLQVIERVLASDNCPVVVFANFSVLSHQVDFLVARRWHCQLIEGSALLPREIDAPDRFQQAHVTASHSTNARVRSRRW